MMELSYRRHRFPPVVIQHAVWLYLRFTLSYRDVEDLLAERGLDISYETVRSWVIRPMSGISRRGVIMQFRRSGTESSLTLRWREMDSNFRFRTREDTDLSFRFLSMFLKLSAF